MKSNSQDINFKSLTPEEVNILKKSNAGLAFDTVNMKNPESEVNIASQNKDTGLPSYNSDDTRPYEQKNTSEGFHKSGSGSK